MLRFSVRNLFVIMLVIGCISFFAFTTQTKKHALEIYSGNAGLTLPPGFSAHTIIDTLGKARHLVVTPQGIIYVKLAKTKNGKGILILHEDASGKATVTGGFGDYGGVKIFYFFCRDFYHIIAKRKSAAFAIISFLFFFGNRYINFVITLR